MRRLATLATVAGLAGLLVGPWPAAVNARRGLLSLGRSLVGIVTGTIRLAQG